MPKFIASNTAKNGGVEEVWTDKKPLALKSVWKKKATGAPPVPDPSGRVLTSETFPGFDENIGSGEDGVKPAGEDTDITPRAMRLDGKSDLVLKGRDEEADEDVRTLAGRINTRHGRKASARFLRSFLPESDTAGGL